MDNLKLALANIFGWIIGHRAAVIAVALGVLVFAIFAGIDSCRQKGIEKKIDRIESNITEQQTISNVLTNQKADVAEEVKNNETNTNVARADLADSRRTDSGVFAGINAEDKYCRKFCEDSTCFEWRKRNAGFVCN